MVVLHLHGQIAYCFIDRSRCSKAVASDCKIILEEGEQLKLTELQNGPSWLIVDCADKPGGKLDLCSFSEVNNKVLGLAGTDTTPEGFLYDVGG